MNITIAYVPDKKSVEDFYLRSRGEFLLGFIDERLVAMGGFKWLSDALAELRRIRIARKLQDRGYGTLLLRELEQRAFQSGVGTLCLDLVIFDIDGTLTQTTKANEECFVRSLAEVCGFGEVDTDWSHYKHTTDSGILKEIYEDYAGRPPSPDEVSRFRQHFIGLLAQVSSEAAFAAVTGAALVLSRLADSAAHRVALATGAWRDSARLKMTSAGLSYDAYPAASSDDALDRESIIRLSMQRAAERYGRLGSTVYVGDGVWDAHACRNVGIPFIGIATDGRAARLFAEGAVCVFSDFRDTDSFFGNLYKTEALRYE